MVCNIQWIHKPRAFASLKGQKEWTQTSCRDEKDTHYSVIHIDNINKV